MLGSLVGNSILTPKLQDGWLFGGFSLKSEIYARERARKKKEREERKKHKHSNGHEMNAMMDQ